MDVHKIKPLLVHFPEPNHKGRTVNSVFLSANYMTAKQIKEVQALHKRATIIFTDFLYIRQIYVIQFTFITSALQWRLDISVEHRWLISAKNRQTATVAEIGLEDYTYVSPIGRQFASELTEKKITLSNNDSQWYFSVKGFLLV